MSSKLPATGLPQANENSLFSQWQSTYRVAVRVHVMEVVEDWRAFLILLYVVPHRLARDVRPRVQVAFTGLRVIIIIIIKKRSSFTINLINGTIYLPMGRTTLKTTPCVLLKFECFTVSEGRKGRELKKTKRSRRKKYVL